MDINNILSRKDVPTDIKDNISNFFELKKIEYGFFQAIPAGIVKGYETIADYLKQLKLIFSPKNSCGEGLYLFP